MEPRFSDDGVVLFLDYDEAPSLEDWIATVTEVKKDPRWPDVTAVIADRSRVAPPTTEFSHGVAAYLLSTREDYHGCRFALVVRDPASFGMARLTQILLDQHECELEIFDDVAKAEAWARGDAPEADLTAAE